MNQRNGESTGWQDRRLHQLLRRAEVDPSVVLLDSRCRKPRFCEAFFELCDGKALQLGSKAENYPRVAVELAAQINDPHLTHLAQGVLAHFHIASCEWAAAGEVLEDSRVSAFACCERCAGDWSRRRADLLTELGDAEGACEELERAARKLGADRDDEMDGRLAFLRGIALHKSDDGERAIGEAGRALMCLSLASPKGYFMDALAFIACFLQFRDERSLYEQALDDLGLFRDRFKGQEGWTEVRLRLSWVEALILARLGEHKKAVERLERVLNGLFKTAPAKHAVAVMIDLTQIFARRASDTDLRAIRRLVDRCQRLNVDKRMRRWLKTIKRVASQTPERTFGVLALFRYSFRVPVPGLLSDKRLR